MVKAALLQPVELACAAIVPSEENPRLSMDKQGLEELAASIRTHGIIQPLVVRAVGDTYEIIAGHRRFKAACMIGLQMVPVRVVATADERQTAAMRIVENLQRTGLNPIEEATALQAMHSQFGMSGETIGAYVGKSGAWVYKSLQLLELPKSVQDALRTRRLTASHGWALERYRAFPRLTDRIAMIAQRDGLSGRAIAVPGSLASELAEQGLLAQLAFAPVGFDFDQCKVCPFSAYFPQEGGYGLCAKPEHYRILAHEARARLRELDDAAKKQTRAMDPRVAPAKGSKQAPPPAQVSEVTRRLKTTEALLERLTPRDLASPEMRVRITRHRGILDRLFGPATREGAEG